MGKTHLYIVILCIITCFDNFSGASAEQESSVEIEQDQVPYSDIESYDGSPALNPSSSLIWKSEPASFLFDDSP